MLGLMRVLATFVFCTALLSAAAADKATVSLPRFGPVPVPQGWRVLDHGSYGTTNKPSDWLVLQHQDKAEYLSFYAFGPPRSQITNAIYFTDTAHEIFPDGRISRLIKARPTYSRGPSTWNLRHELVNLVDYEVLEYSFIADFEGSTENLLAHGYVLFGDFAMIVQHTSDRPTTPEFVQGIAAEMMRGLSKISAAKNLKRK